MSSCDLLKMTCMGSILLIGIGHHVDGNLEIEALEAKGIALPIKYLCGIIIRARWKLMYTCPTNGDNHPLMSTSRPNHGFIVGTNGLTHSLYWLLIMRTQIIEPFFFLLNIKMVYSYIKYHPNYDMNICIFNIYTFYITIHNN